MYTGSTSLGGGGSVIHRRTAQENTAYILHKGESYKMWITRTCEICGKRYQTGNGKAKYCGDSCRKEAIKRKQAEWRKLHPEYHKEWKKNHPEYAKSKQASLMGTTPGPKTQKLRK